MIEWNKLGFVICERSLYMQIFNLDRSYLFLSSSSLCLLLPYQQNLLCFHLLAFMKVSKIYIVWQETSRFSSWAWDTSIIYELGSPVFITQSWLFLGTSLPHFCWCFSKLAPCSHPGKLLLSIPLLSLSLIFFFLSHSPHPSHWYVAHCFSSHRLHNMKNLRFRKNNT